MSSSVAPRLPIICSRVTLTMDVSMSCSSAAETTVTMTIHFSSPIFTAISFPRSTRVHVDGNVHGHARAQPRVRPVPQGDAHGDALHHLGVIAGGVVGRQQAEAR